MAGGGRRRGAARAGAALLGLLLAVVLPGAAWARLEFLEKDIIPIEPTKFFRSVISSDEAWIVLFLSGSETDRGFIDNTLEALTEIKNVGKPMPKVGYVSVINDAARIVATKLDLMEELPTCQGFLVKKDKEAMVELADRHFADNSGAVDVGRDFIQYYRDWAEEFPQPEENDTVVMKLVRVGKDDNSEL